MSPEPDSLWILPVTLLNSWEPDAVVARMSPSERSTETSPLPVEMVFDRLPAGASEKINKTVHMSLRTALNVALKTMEGVARMLFETAREEARVRTMAARTASRGLPMAASMAAPRGMPVWVMQVPNTALLSASTEPTDKSMPPAGVSVV